MKHVFWHGMAEEEKIDYLRKFSVAVVGSRMLMEILWRSGVGCIRYISDYVSPLDARLDCTIDPLEANNYDIVHPKSTDSCVISYLLPESESEIRKLLRGIDVVVAHRNIELFAEMAEKIGAPFIPDIITTFLPDGVKFCEVEYPEVKMDPISYSITCSIQAGEILRVFTGYHLPTIAPEAYIVDVRSENYLRKITLRVK